MTTSVQPPLAAFSHPNNVGAFFPPSHSAKRILGFVYSHRPLQYYSTYSHGLFPAYHPPSIKRPRRGLARVTFPLRTVSVPKSIALFGTQSSLFVLRPSRCKLCLCLALASAS